MNSQELPKTPTRVHGMDGVLHGGLPAGRTTVVAGGPGTGKTMLALEILYRGAHAGEPGIFVTFEERADAVRQNAHSLGWNLEALEETGTFAILQADVPPELVLSGEFGIDGLLSILAGQVTALGARCIVIDAVDVLMRVFHDPVRQQNQLQILHRWLQDRDITAILTAKAAPEHALQHPVLDYMADCVIRLDQRIERGVTTRRLRVLKYRGSDFLSNEHSFLIARDGIVMMPVTKTELVQQPLGTPVSVGDPNADTILGGGFREASTVLVAGTSGTGKTTFAVTFALAAAQRDERALYVSFEESEAALVSSMRSPGLDLEPSLESGQLRVLTAMPESRGIEDHLLHILRAVEAYDPQHIVVDAISATHRMGSQQSAFDFLVRLLTWAKEHGVTCLCTNQIAHAPDPEQLSGFGISSLMDSLILLEQIHQPAYQRRMLVVKSRGLAHSHDYHPFSITDRGLRFPAPLSEQVEGTSSDGVGGHDS